MRTSGALCFSDLVCRLPDLGNGAVATVLGRKVVVSVQSGKGKRKVTEIEGIPAQHSLEQALKKLQKMHACGGHVAKVNDSDSGEVLVLHGKFSAEVTRFLIQEGLADSDSIIHRG